MDSPGQYNLQEIAAAVVFVISGVLAALGYKKGGAAAKENETVVAASMVENQAVYKLASSIDEHNHMMEAQIRTIEKLVEGVAQSCRAIEKLADKVQDAATDIIRNQRDR